MKRLKLEITGNLTENQILENCEEFGLDLEICRYGENYGLEFNVKNLENEEIWEVIENCKNLFNIIELKVNL